MLKKFNNIAFIFLFCSLTGYLIYQVLTVSPINPNEKINDNTKPYFVEQKKKVYMSNKNRYVIYTSDSSTIDVDDNSDSSYYTVTITGSKYKE